MRRILMRMEGKKLTGYDLKKVDRILDRKMGSEGLVYLVKLAGESYNDCTYFPARTIPVQKRIQFTNEGPPSSIRHYKEGDLQIKINTKHHQHRHIVYGDEIIRVVEKTGNNYIVRWRDGGIGKVSLNYLKLHHCKLLIEFHMKKMVDGKKDYSQS